MAKEALSHFIYIALKQILNMRARITISLKFMPTGVVDKGYSDIVFELNLERWS